MRRGGPARSWWWLGIGATAVLAGAASVLAVVLLSSRSAGTGKAPLARPGALATNPNLDPGTPLSGPAPDFTLTDQFGRRVSLRSFRGRAVLLAFVDSECRTVCPLTTEAMVRAKRLLGASADRVALLGIDANPDATAVRYVRAYSRVHEMLHQWHFLTAPLPQLKRVWKAYGVDAQIRQGEVDHTPALFAVSPNGTLSRAYLTPMAYASIPQQAQVLAREASRLLPGHPQASSSLSYEPVPLVRPHSRATLPLAGGGTVRLGPGSPRLLVFFTSWLDESSSLAARLQELDRYQAAHAGSGLPELVAVDEGSVEPSASALPRLLASLATPLSYPVAIDESGRLADGYRVQDQPWYVLVSRSGRILWHHDGWLSVAALQRRVRSVLAGS